MTNITITFIFMERMVKLILEAMTKKAAELPLVEESGNYMEISHGYIVLGAV